MIRNEHVCGTPNAMCDTECMENAYRPLGPRYTEYPYTASLIQYDNTYAELILAIDRESFEVLKELLRIEAAMPIGNSGISTTPSSRRTQEALKRVFDQLRDMQYGDV